MSRRRHFPEKPIPEDYVINTVRDGLVLRRAVGQPIAHFGAGLQHADVLDWLNTHERDRKARAVWIDEP